MGQAANGWVVAAMALVVAGVAGAQPPLVHPGKPVEPHQLIAPKDISSLLAPILQTHGVPGMAAALVEGDRIVMWGAAGVRRAGSPDKVTLEDKFHLGSCTKSMTATLCATLVEAGRLNWTSTLAEVFPAEAAGMNADYRTVTLSHLLHHRAGVPGDLSAGGLWGKLWNFQGTTTQGREFLLTSVTASAPHSPPGSAYQYANAGFAIAGLMGERVTRHSWEQLIATRLFEPLGIKGFGFGAPGTAAAFDQPRGHRKDGTPMEPGPGADNPALMGPAGTVHMPIADWAKYVSLHLRGDAANPNRSCAILKPATFDVLHAPWLGEVGNGYAMGWSVSTRPWAKGARKEDKGLVLTHNGSNTLWFCVAWLAPERDFAVIVCCNKGEKGDAATDAAAAKLIAEYTRPRTSVK